MPRVISTGDAPVAVGAYSQAATDGDLVFTAGQLPLTPDGDLLEGSVGEQTEQCLDNVEAILEREGLSLSDVLKLGISFDGIGDFEEMNGTYAEYFDEEPPARSALGGGRVPTEATLGIETIAVSG